MQVVEYDACIPRWYVRFGCDGRDAATIYFDLHQRTLRYELYFVPDPPGHHEDAVPVPAPAQPLALRRTLLDRPRRRRLPHRSHAARAPRRRGARPHHRRALRARRAVVPARDPRIAFRRTLTASAPVTSSCRTLSSELACIPSSWSRYRAARARGATAPSFGEVRRGVRGSSGLFYGRVLARRCGCAAVLG